MPPVVGIDLGTSNSAVASLINGKHQVIPDDQGQRLTVSAVSFGRDQAILVGADAKAQIYSNPTRTITSIKRLIGRKIFSPEVKKSQILCPYHLVEGQDQNVAIDLEGQIYSPQEISAFILKHLKQIAEKKIGEEIREAVVTVPAHFNDNQRQATKDACRIAGLDALRIINEPTAAALAYGFGKGLQENVAIYDLGGGTFDISILRLKNEIFEVVATSGDTFLGGDDFDDRIMDLCAEEFLKLHHVDLRQIAQALPLLRASAEKAKRKLSYAEKTDIFIPGIVQKGPESIDLKYSISRTQFQNASEDLIQRTFAVCDEALRAASLKPSDLDAIILVGGSTKMSLVYDVVSAYFQKSPLRDLNPEEVVAIGASIQAHSLRASKEIKGSSSKALLLDVTPLDLGIATVNGYIETIVEANSPIPISANRNFTTTHDNQSSVSIRIFQGKNRREESSTLLGEFEFSGFKVTRSGDVSIEVLFSINTDGIVEVSAKDKETGAAQTIKVKLAASLSNDGIKNSQSKAEQHREVRIKDEWRDADKVVLALLEKSDSGIYEEGFMKSLELWTPEIVLFSEGNHKPKTVDKKKVAYALTVSDFANIPRYLRAISEKPTKIDKEPRSPLYQFELTNGEIIFGMSQLPKVREEGFWIEPYFSNEEELPGKVYLYSAHIKQATPLAI